MEVRTGAQKQGERKLTRLLRTCQVSPRNGHWKSLTTSRNYVVDILHWTRERVRREAVSDVD